MLSFGVNFIHLSEGFEINYRKWGLVCPRCAGDLQEIEKGLTCPHCENSWPIVNGIPYFIQNHPYRGEIPLETFREILRLAKRNSWRQVLQEHSDPKVQEASKMILNIDRANWHLLVDLPQSSRVLDVGAGTGAISHALAKRFHEVIAVEPVLERAQFLQLRFRQEDFSNVMVIRSSIWELPLAPSSVDLIVLNGVLEWVAEGSLDAPDQVQKSALNRVFQLLRPGGYLYLGIGNRLFIQYLVGARDPHSGLPFVTVLPRQIAQWYARKRGKSAYSNYLYSYWGYRRILRTVGFSDVQIYNALPSYDEPRYLVPVEQPIFSYFAHHFPLIAPPSNIIKKMVHWILNATGVLKYLQYSFVILAKK